MQDTTIYVAYADDQEMPREGIANLLEDTENRIKVFIRAKDGTDLLERIARATHQPDVCLIDIRMPRMDGYETVKQVRQRYPYTRCLAFMGFEITDHSILQMLQNGALGFAVKMGSPRELACAIKEVYAGKFYFCPDVLKIFPKISGGNVHEYVKHTLTQQQVELLKYCCTALTNAEIADRMHLSTHTVNNYYQKLSDQLDIHGRHLLALYAVYAGIGTFESVVEVKI